MTSKAEPPSYSNPDAHAVAIVGIAIQAPGGADGTVDAAGLFDLLQKRASSIMTIPTNRWNAQTYTGEAPGKVITDKGAFLCDVGVGDLQEFGISTREASQMSPQQLHALHVSFEALQHSGINFRGTNTGVFMGCANSELGLEQDETEIQEYYCLGSTTSIVANRISYVFDLTGPSLPVDTACSSTLTAMHLAVQAIRNGDCDQAVVGGVSFILSLLDAVSFSQLGVLSPDGISKSFDADANGYARGEVAGAVVIKRHDLAIRDGDHIYGTLVGTALTTCGSAMGSITTPNPVTQAEAIRRAYANAGLQPCDADFVELHGTGTRVGDRTEANAAGAIFSHGRRGLPLPIGSIKSNIGHGEMGAYISSLIKVAMMLDKKVILPNGYFNKPSPEIEFEKYNLYVPVVTEDFVPQNRQHGLIASISSYGFGGSCGHTVLREHESRPDRSDEVVDVGLYLFAVGALSPRACNSLADTYISDYTHVSGPLLSEHMGTKARQMPWRSFAVAPDIAQASFSKPVLVAKVAPLVFCFSGQGPQHLAMGKGLFYQHSSFRESILASDAAYTKYVGSSFLEETNLFIADDATSLPVSDQRIWPALNISVSITMFQIALYDLLVTLGLRPSMIIGHSIGETAAFYASGSMSREMVIQIAVARGRALSLVDGQGSMLAVSGCTKEELDFVICLVAGEHSAPLLHIAAYNSARDFGVSGRAEDIDNLKTKLEQNFPESKAVKLRVSTAVHSPFVDSCEVSYRHELKQIFANFDTPTLPIIPVVSSVTAQPISRPYDIDYMWDNLRQPVQFSPAFNAVKQAVGDELVVIELSPHPVLTQYLYMLGATEAISLSHRPPRNLTPSEIYHAQIRTFLEALGSIILSGINSVDLRRLNGWPKGDVDPPPYPFQKKAHKVFPQVSSYVKRLQPPSKPLNSSLLRVSPSLPEPWMADHVINRSNIIPASAYIEMALEFPGVTSVWDFEFVKAFALDGDGAAGTLEVRKIGDQVEIISLTKLASPPVYDTSFSRVNSTHSEVQARGRVGYGKPYMDGRCLARVDMGDVTSRCPFYFTGADVDAELSAWAQFGPMFRRVIRGCANSSEVLCWIRGPVDVSSIEYIFHPALMDAAFQSFVGWPLQWAHVNTNADSTTFGLPHSLERCFRNDDSVGPLLLPPEFSVYSRMTEWTPHSRTMDCFILDTDGSVLFTFLGLQFKEPGRPSPPSMRYTEHWQDRAFLSDEPRFPPPELRSDTLVSELVLISRALDDFARKYTQRTLCKIALLPEDLPYDRQKYVEWATHVVSEADVEIVIPDSLQDDRNPLRELTERVAKAQLDIMISSTAAVQALFVDNLMSQIYELSLFDGEVFGQTTRAIVQAVSQAFVRGRKVVRILEIGAGTGRMTALLGEALLAHGKPADCFVDYICTDISISLAQEAVKKSPWPTTTAKAFDITRSAAEQNILEASFDIIVAFDVLHAIPKLQDLLVALRRLLVPGGFLAAIEIDGEAFALALPGTIWLDYIFGSFREWFGALQHRDGNPHCTLTQEAWGTRLHLAGLKPTSWAKDKRPTARHIGFLAQNTAEPCYSDVSSYELNSVTPPSVLYYHWVPEGEIDLIAFLSRQDSTKYTVIWIHTEDTIPARALIGIGRSLQQEFPLWQIHTVLFAHSWYPEGQKQFIREKLASYAWADPEILVDMNGGMRVSRLVPWPDPPTSRALTQHELHSVDASGREYPVFTPPLGPYDVEVLVDRVVLASWFEPFAEFIGTVVAIGSDIDVVSSRIRVGQCIFGMAENSRTRKVVCPIGHVEAIPPHLTDHQHLVSTIGIATLGRITEHLILSSTSSPTVLLHLGDAKGIAAAMYQILSCKGIQLAVTVNSSVLDSFPRQFAVFATHSIEEWTHHVKTWTPSGIDVILDCQADYHVLSDAASLLRPTGTIMRLNKDGVMATSPPLRSAQRFVSIDLHALVTADPTFLQTAFSGLDERLIPCLEAFTIENDEPLVGSSRHTSEGDYVATQGNVYAFQDSKELTPGRVRALSTGAVSFDPRRTYVVIGGIGGVGIAFTSCLVERGARNIVLTSRSGAKGLSSCHLMREKLVLDFLQGIPGVSIRLVAADCTNEGDMRGVFSTIEYAGVFFMPVFLADALALNMIHQTDWDNVYDVKVKGLKTLLNVVNTQQLDFLLVASSMASVLGSPGQANYTAAQTWMEALAENVPKCVTIAVPPILDGGVFVRFMPKGENRNAALEKYLNFGMLGKDFCFYCLEAISMILSESSPSLYIPEIGWEHALRLVPFYAQSRIRHLVQANFNIATDETNGGVTLRDVCASVLALEATSIEDNIPLTSYGLDSLTSVRLSNILKGNFGLNITQMQLLASTMTYSRLHRLYCDSSIVGNSKPLNEERGQGNQHLSLPDAIAGVQHYSADYEHLKQQLKRSYSPISTSYLERPLTILLTGATGFIGGFLLNELLAQSRTKKVICLVRCDGTSDPSIRLREAMSSHAHGAWDESWFQTSRVQALRGDLSHEQFGLTRNQWDHLAMEVDCIIHNGALVHWVHSYETLRATNVLSVLTAINLASTGRPKCLIYVSSIATSGSGFSYDPNCSCTADDRRIMEASTLEETRASLTFGYAQSKWVSEKLLYDAAQRGLDGYVIKPSFVLGDSISGACNPKDFFWRLVKGCIQLGYIPDLETSLNAIPVDQLAKLISYAALNSPHSRGLKTLHLDHDLCEYSLWLEHLERAICAEEDNALLPVLDFAHNLELALTIPPLDVTRTTELLSSSTSLQVAMRITDETFITYLSWLAATGALPPPSHLSHANFDD